VNRLTARSAPGLARGRPAQSARTPLRYLTWAVPGVLTLALGLLDLGVPMLWRDELATWSAATRTPSQLWGMLHNTDAVLGPYYFGMHLWMGVFGQSAVAMRLPSVFAMTAAAVAVALTGKRLGGTAVGLLGGLVFAVIPSVSRYAQEARPYAFATLFAALATLLLLRAMERPNWLRWALYAVAIGAAGAANLVALCILAGHIVIVGVDFSQRTVRIGGEGDAGRTLPGGRPEPIEGQPLALVGWFCISAAIGIVLDAPIVIEGHSQTAYQLGQQPVPHVADLFRPTGGLWAELFSSTPVSLLVVLLALTAVVWTAGARRRVTALYILACAVLPILAVWVISQGPNSYWTYRYMLFTVPAWALAAGFGIATIAERLSEARPAAISRRLFSAVVATAIVALTVVAGAHDQWEIRQYEAHNAWAFPVQMANGEPVNYPAAAAVIAENARPGDAIIYQSSDANHYEVNAAIAYYLRGKPPPTPVFQAETPVAADNLQAEQCEDPSLCITGTPRIWVVYVDHLAPNPSNPFSALPGAQASYLTILGYQTKFLWQATGITVALLTVN
jgi:mannosyltransferase